MGESLGIPFMLDAIKAALQIIAPLPKCAETERLEREADWLRSTVESWRIALPGQVAREGVMQGVLLLHVRASKFARSAPTLDRSMDRPTANPTPRVCPPEDEGQRPTIPPPFDVEAFARDSERELPSEPSEPHLPSTIERAVTGAVEVPLGRSGSVEERTGEMLDCMSFGDYARALDIADVILTEAAGNLRARQCRDTCRAALAAIYLEQLAPLERVPVVIADTTRLECLRLEPRTRFLVSVIDGTSSVEAVLDVCGMPKFDALRILQELLQRRVIGFG